MANETSGRRDNRVPFRASTKTPNIMMLRRTRFLLIVCGILAFAVLGIKLFNVMIVHHDEYEKNGKLTSRCARRRSRPRAARSMTRTARSWP